MLWYCVRWDICRGRGVTKAGPPSRPGPDTEPAEGHCRKARPNSNSPLPLKTWQQTYYILCSSGGTGLWYLRENLIVSQFLSAVSVPLRMMRSHGLPVCRLPVSLSGPSETLKSFWLDGLVRTAASFQGWPALSLSLSRRRRWDLITSVWSPSASNYISRQAWLTRPLASPHSSAQSKTENNEDWGIFSVKFLCFAVTNFHI